jgi:L-alanine-DL-glutamate epimerase-like enolase superfamily enzyme
MAGGITGLRKVYTLCEAYNKPMMPHCPSAGISSAASLNLYATYQHAVRPHEYSYEFSGSLEAVAGLFQESIIPENGFIDLPDRPGHGLVLDEDAFAAAKAAF